MRDARADLVAHIGGKPSATQLALIDRAAWIMLHMAQIDARASDGKAMTEHDSRTYLAWTNTLSKTLRHLGLQGKHQAPPTLRDHVAARTAVA